MSVLGSVLGSVAGSIFGSIGDVVSPVVVPTLVGFPAAVAQDIVDNVNLQLNASFAYSDMYATGTIISQSPTAGTSVFEGAVISVVISLGPRPTQTRSYWAARRKRSENVV